MMESGFEAIKSALARYRSLEEALLIQLRLVDYGYTVELDFDLWSDGHGLNVPLPSESHRSLTFRLVGVMALEFVGGLTPTMLANPDRIDWGLSEVAAVAFDDSGQGPCLQVLWETQRRIVIHFQSAQVIE